MIIENISNIIRFVLDRHCAQAIAMIFISKDQESDELQVNLPEMKIHENIANIQL